MAVKWLQTGEDSAKLEKQAKEAAELAKEQQGKMWRFFLKEGEDAKITFVDGDLSKEGFLLPHRYYEHMVMLNNKWQNFVCPKLTLPNAKDCCPFCEGQDRASLVALFTVIDHRSFTGKDGKVYKDSPKLLVAKPMTVEILNKIAQKRGGLAGASFDVSRTGKKDAAVGNLFDFTEKLDLATLKAKYTRKVKDASGKETLETYFVPAKYEEEIVFRTGAELKAMPGMDSAGGPAPASSHSEAADGQYEEHL